MEGTLHGILFLLVQLRGGCGRFGKRTSRQTVTSFLKQDGSI